MHFHRKGKNNFSQIYIITVFSIIEKIVIHKKITPHPLFLSVKQNRYPTSEMSTKVNKDLNKSQ